ncbi:lycopene cyclase domain-containing protein [Ulvibacter antarcticus]|uniref:Lycopene cyclase domain-containing protein n=1 Tax=Ulvibacter antarcticus TaxID=442714 RepID=A0A3L9Y6C4_9FLAO|nr:lycopene cyclase domain-containing protein [Ulvibacter antarcticus]RMA56266.1 lycopene cyclase domain-containing protein [Ulvibacter antarcticus]
MEYLYLLLDLGSISVPLLFSFHPKLPFYKKWRSLFPAILCMMLFFIPWDILFTVNGFWGFNDTYLTGVELLHLPIEEWLFFICIPYACLFTHYALQYFFPKPLLSEKTTNIIYILLITGLIIGLLYYYERWYTVVNFGYALLILGLVYNKNRAQLRSFFPTFIFILIPFFIINGILTGSWIEAPVVWYNASENIGIRLLTIPVEDIIYALSMLLTVLALTEYFESFFRKTK